MTKAEVEQLIRELHEESSDCAQNAPRRPDLMAAFLSQIAEAMQAILDGDIE